MHLLPACSYYLRRLIERTLRQQLHRVTDLLNASGERYYELEKRLQQLYPDRESRDNVILHLEKLVSSHQHAQSRQALSALRELTAQILWWLGYDTCSSCDAPTIFVIDDTIETIKLVTTILGNAGYRVESALSGYLALMMIETRRPDLILLDIKLPDIDGYELYRTLKSLPLVANIPVIFLSGLSSKSQIKTSEFQDTYTLAKPFKPRDLVEAVQAHLSVEVGDRSSDQLSTSGLEERLYQALKLSSPFGCMAQDAYLDSAIYFFRTTLDGRYLRVSPSFAHLCGYENSEEMIFQILNLWEQVYIEPDYQAQWAQCLQHPNQFRTLTAQIKTRQGNLLDVTERICVVEDAHRNLLFYQGHLDCNPTVPLYDTLIDQKQTIDTV